MTGIDKRANHEVWRGKAPVKPPGERKAQWSTPRLIRPSLDLTELAKVPNAIEIGGIPASGPLS
jgi:hypothetical protein